MPLQKTKLKRTYNKSKLSNPDVNHLRKQFIEANNRFLLSNQETDKVHAALLKKEYDLKLKSARRDASEAFISESTNRSKAIWQIINRERAVRKKSEELSWKLDISGEIVTDATQVADHFNSYFTTVAEEILKTNNPPHNQDHQDRYKPTKSKKVFSFPSLHLL
ncbi:hypothetical protein J6590_078683 [Homalodisca vitripennis]|nr:hypothetical protein J6590_078683 [Homalodisca vitripennis]